MAGVPDRARSARYAVAQPLHRATRSGSSSRRLGRRVRREMPPSSCVLLLEQRHEGRSAPRAGVPRVSSSRGRAPSAGSGPRRRRPASAASSSSCSSVIKSGKCSFAKRAEIVASAAATQRRTPAWILNRAGPHPRCHRAHHPRACAEQSSSCARRTKPGRGDARSVSTSPSLPKARRCVLDDVIR